MKPKCTKETIQQAVKLKKAGVTNKDIASALCIHESTLYRWIGEPKTDEQRKLGEALKKTEADYKASLQTLIYNAAVERDWKAAAWLLERKYPQEFARQIRPPVQFEPDIEDSDAFFTEAGL